MDTQSEALPDEGTVVLLMAVHPKNGPIPNSTPYGLLRLTPSPKLLTLEPAISAPFRVGEHPIDMVSLRRYLRFLAAVQLLPALESGEETLVGGQAVLEGVMMRSPHAWAIACRKPSGEVVTLSEPLERPSEQHKWMGWPVVRGVMTLGHAMTLGFRALKFSA